MNQLTTSRLVEPEGLTPLIKGVPIPTGHDPKPLPSTAYPNNLLPNVHRNVVFPFPFPLSK
jgi:hypothetical protein